MNGKPTRCYYTKDCIASSTEFTRRTIGSGCIGCTLTDSEGCDYLISQEEWDAIARDPESWKLIAHCVGTY
jgi:hypothetical protein